MGDDVRQTVIIGAGCIFGEGVKLWRGVHCREGVSVGDGTSIGEGVYVGPGVRIGANCKIQNRALIYEPSEIGNNVFIGPAAIFTNDKKPRAVNPDLTPKTSSDWQPEGVVVKEGASLGAGVICVAPVIIGEWSFVAAGSLVTKNVQNFALVAGSPARQIGWVGRGGSKLLEQSDGSFLCPDTGDRFRISEGGLSQLPIAPISRESLEPQATNRLGSR